MAQEVVDQVNEEPRGGAHELEKAEFLWGAFGQCLMAFANDERLPDSSPGA